MKDDLLRILLLEHMRMKRPKAKYKITPYCGSESICFSYLQVARRLGIENESNYKEIINNEINELSFMYDEASFGGNSRTFELCLKAEATYIYFPRDLRKENWRR